VRTIDEATAEALNGSRAGDELEVFAWYNGRLAVPTKLDVSDWSLRWDGSASKLVQGVLDLNIADRDGSLAPWLFDDPLGVGGAVLQCRYLVGGAGMVNMGWYRITSNAPKESWYSRVIPEAGHQNEPEARIPYGHRLVMVSGGSTVPVTAQDLTVNLTLDRFLAPEQPPAGAKVHSEIRRIVGDYMPVTIGDDVPDTAVPSGTTYDDERMGAVIDLADSVGARFRMGGNGELQIYMPSTDPVWTVTGGDGGALINVDRSQDIDQLRNIGVARGEQKWTDEAGQEQTRPLQSVATIDIGPIRSGGPAGRIPVFLDSPLLHTQEAVDKAARTLIDNRVTGLTTDLEVTCLPHPALQVGDWVTVTQPIIDGTSVPLTGEVTDISLRRGTAMTLRVRCSTEAVQHVIRSARGL